MNVKGSMGSMPNYEPNSVTGTAKEDKIYAIKKEDMVGEAGRYSYVHPNDNYEQARALFMTVMDAEMRGKVVANISGGLGQCRRDIQERMLPHFYKVAPAYGEGISKTIGVPIERPRL
jgi:catalase